MATQVVMPKLSPTMEEGQLSRWLKKEGEKVTVGEPLAEIDTDKATMEAQALAEGVVRKILVKEGETVPLGTIIAIIGAPDEDISTLLSQAQSSENSANNKKNIEESVQAGGDGAATELAQVVPGGARTQATIAGQPLKNDTGGSPSEQKSSSADAKSHAPLDESASNGDSEAQHPKTGARLIVSPIAARMAAEGGVNLQTLTGSGPGGRIVKRDIESALANSSPAKTAEASEQTPAQETQTDAKQTPPAFTSSTVEGASPYRDAPVSTMRNAIARRLVSSLGPVPHFFLTTEIEMDRAAELRRQLNELNPELKISINDLIIKVAAVALTQHPSVNASFQDKTIRHYERADIGVAVAIEDGLITPVVRGANSKSVGQISREVRELAERARTRKLKPEEYTGATFSISNLGMLGIDDFTAIINPPEAAILAVGTMQPKPVVRDGEVTVRQMMRVTLSCDHRVIDGATGAKFLQTFRKILENPLYLIA